MTSLLVLFFILMLVLPVLSLPAGAQARFGAALKFGVPVQSWFSGVGGREFSVDQSQHASAGLSAEARITNFFSVEGAGVYRCVGLDSGGGYIPFEERERGSGWEFPILGKYRIPVHLAGLSPFVEGGPSLQWLRTFADSWSATSIAGFLAPAKTTFHHSDWRTGVAVAGGVEKRVGPIRFTLAARYTSWRAEACYENLRCVQPNQATLEFGVGF